MIALTVLSSKDPDTLGYSCHQGWKAEQKPGEGTLNFCLAEWVPLELWGLQKGTGTQ